MGRDMQPVSADQAFAEAGLALALTATREWTYWAVRLADSDPDASRECARLAAVAEERVAAARNELALLAHDEAETR